VAHPRRLGHARAGTGGETRAAELVGRGRSPSPTRGRVLDAGDRCRNLVTAIVKASDVIFAAD
jgi:hypothetical protein